MDETLVKDLPEVIGNIPISELENFILTIGIACTIGVTVPCVIFGIIALVNWIRYW